MIAALLAVPATIFLLAPASAWACNCQKEYLIKKFGTLSVLDLPERPMETAEPRAAPAPPTGPAEPSDAEPPAPEPASAPAAEVDFSDQRR